MSTSTKVVLPSPPPTINELTAQQRTQLVRTTRKIEQILGTTPRVVDIKPTSEPSPPIRLTVMLKSRQFDGSINRSFPDTALYQRRLTKTRRTSVDSGYSVSSFESRPPQYGERPSSLFSSIQSKKSARNSTSSCNYVCPLEAWASGSPSPLLRLVMESSTLEAIPTSLDPTQTSFVDSPPQSPSYSQSNTVEDAPSCVFPLTLKETSLSSNSPSLDSITIPSPNGLRKQKMDRLRKKLGSEVPSNLVFPKKCDTGNLPTRSDKDCPPRPATLRRNKAKGGIASARNSISDITSIHRAPRRLAQPVNTSIKRDVKHRKTGSETAPTALRNAHFRRVKHKLSLIIESPDEHGAACSEGFGIPPRLPTKSNMDLVSGWLADASDTGTKFWSTREGYEGWNPDAYTSFSPTSSFTISSSDDEVSSFDLASPVLSSESSHSTGPMPSTEKKRAPSYRKPVPPILVDLF